MQNLHFSSKIESTRNLAISNRTVFKHVVSKRNQKFWEMKYVFIKSIPDLNSIKTTSQYHNMVYLS